MKPLTLICFLIFNFSVSSFAQLNWNRSEIIKMWDRNPDDFMPDGKDNSGETKLAFVYIDPISFPFTIRDNTTGKILETTTAKSNTTSVYFFNNNNICNLISTVIPAPLLEKTKASFHKSYTYTGQSSKGFSWTDYNYNVRYLIDNINDKTFTVTCYHL